MSETFKRTTKDKITIILSPTQKDFFNKNPDIMKSAFIRSAIDKFIKQYKGD
jgi:hypothetical protein